MSLVWDLRGVVSVAAGSLLHYLVLHDADLGNNKEARLEQLNEKMLYHQRHTHRVSHQMPRLRLENLQVDSWAALGVLFIF